MPGLNFSGTVASGSRRAYDGRGVKPAERVGPSGERYEGRHEL